MSVEATTQTTEQQLQFDESQNYQPDDEVSKLKISELREELEARGLDITGLKSVLCDRLRKALEDEKRDGDFRNSGVVKLFVGQVPAQTTEEELRKLFSPYGEVKEALILKDRTTGQPKGCGFVTYATKAEADKAVEALHDKAKLPGAKRELIVRAAGLRPEEEGKEYKLYVGMLSRKSTEEDIRKLFEPYGDVIEIYLMRGKDPAAQSKGAAFVKYPTRDEALRAVQALNGRFRDKDAPGMLQVRFAHTKEEKLVQQRLTTPTILPFQFGGLGGALGGGLGGALPGNPYGGQPGFFGQSPEFGLQAQNPYSNFYAPQQQQPSSGTIQTGPAGSNVFIYNLPESYDDNDLASLFGNFGVVLSTKVQRDRVTGHSKGFGFVSFDNPKSASAAIAALDNFMIGSKRLNVRLKKGDIMSTGSGSSTGYAPY